MPDQTDRMVRPSEISDYSDTPVGDVLVHLAEDRDIFSTQKREETCQKKALGTLGDLMKKGFGRIVYGSSALVYGDKKNYLRNPSESVSPEKIYSQTKLACEKLIQEERNS